MFTTKKKYEELEAENAHLRQWVDYLKGADAVAVSAEVGRLTGQRNALVSDLHAATAELQAARAGIVETSEVAMLQEVGVYAYAHRLEDAVAYKSRLTELRAIIKAMTSAGDAVTATQSWMVNNSAAEGRRMVKDFSKLMLRAYNAEADNAVRTMRPYALAQAKDRLTKVRDTIAKLGRTMDIRISDAYHAQRLYELELTADYLVKAEEEKERVRAERERAREEEKARKEFEAEKARLLKERAHYLNALAKLREAGDTDGVAQLEAQLADVDAAYKGVEEREANIRTGYVYVISNIGAFGEHIVKVGMTRRLVPEDRVRELGDASVPFRFDTHALIFSQDAVGLEGKLHAALADKRVNQVNLQREFFYATPGEVRSALEGIGDPDVLLEFHDVPEALEWRGSGGAERRTALTGTLATSTETATAVAAATEPETASDGSPPAPLTQPMMDQTDLPAAAAEVPEPQPALPAEAVLEPAVSVESAPAVVAPSTTAAAPPEPVPAVEEAPNVAAGWYQDPHSTGRLRYWDGNAWTDHTN